MNLLLGGAEITIDPKDRERCSKDCNFLFEKNGRNICQLFHLGLTADPFRLGSCVDAEREMVRDCKAKHYMLWDYVLNRIKKEAPEDLDTLKRDFFDRIPAVNFRMPMRACYYCQLTEQKKVYAKQGEEGCSFPPFGSRLKCELGEELGYCGQEGSAFYELQAYMDVLPEGRNSTICRDLARQIRDVKCDSND